MRKKATGLHGERNFTYYIEKISVMKHELNNTSFIRDVCVQVPQ